MIGRRIPQRMFGDINRRPASVIISAGALLLAVLPPLAAPPLPVARIQLCEPEAAAPALVPQWNFGAPLAQPPQANTPSPGAMLIPNWEVGRNAVQLLSNYQAGMGKFVLVEERTGDLVPLQVPTFSARSTLSPQLYPVSPVIQPPVFGRLTSEPPAASQ